MTFKQITNTKSFLTQKFYKQDITTDTTVVKAQVGKSDDLYNFTQVISSKQNLCIVFWKLTLKSM